MSGEGVGCPCDGADEWCQALVETGYPFCERCREHHRHPETCGGITEDGDDAFPSTSEGE